MGGKKGKKSKKKSKPKTKAQKMAVANKAKYGGTASAAKANKAAGKAKAGSIAKGTTGIGPVSSGKTYAKAVNTAKNQPKKKTSGIGPYADGDKYAAALKASPPKFKDGTKVASHDKPLFKSVPATGVRGDQPASDFYKEGMLQKNILPSTPGNLLGIKTAAAGDLTGLGISPTTSTNYFKIKSPDTFGAPSQEAVDKAAGITAGGLNIGGSGFTPDKPSGGANARAIFPGASPNSVLNDPNFTPGPVAGDPFAQPGPGGPEPEADYTSYQPGSYYNQSDTNMNPTNFLRSTRNVVTTPFRMLGINNGLTNMLIPKSDEAIQDARDQRGPRPTLTRRGGGGGARLPVAAATPEEILLEEAPTQTGSTYQQSGLDNNNLMQIRQNAYNQELARIYNPLEIGGFNPFFRFFGRGRGLGGGAFRAAFRRD